MDFVMTFERVYREKVYDGGKKKTVLRLVRWNRIRPYVENREFILGDKEEWIPKKSRGMTAEDLDLLMGMREQLGRDFASAEKVSFPRE